MDFETLNHSISKCRLCPRLVAWREEVSHTKRSAYRDWEYWGRPVPGFGDRHARILVVGLAPGAHGSNRTGRQFTGDASGGFLFPALHRAGFASRPDAISRDDDLRLRGLYLTASCRCVPPKNKPRPEELENCRPYLAGEIQLLAPRVIVCLGRIALSQVLKVHELRERDYPFGHGLCYELPWRDSRTLRWLLCSYHPSQQNTLTGRLTKPMFDRIWIKARKLADLA